MEMLFAPTEHRNQSYGPGRFGSSSPSKNFRQINCRTFQSGDGLLPRPNRSHSTHHVTGCASQFHSVDNAKSCPIPITSKSSRIISCSNGFLEESRSLTNELWAGPTYSNSPPPSSVPIPKFSLRQKRTVSLNLSPSEPRVEVRPFAKSAPASPTREHNSSVEELFQSIDSATETLRRILHIDIADK